jgi:hypothetical protein
MRAVFAVFYSSTDSFYTRLGTDTSQRAQSISLHCCDISYVTLATAVVSHVLNSSRIFTPVRSSAITTKPYIKEHKEQSIPVSLFSSVHALLPSASPPAVSCLLDLSLTARFS